MTETHQPPMTRAGLFHPILDDVVATTKNWWLLLVAGVAWIVIAAVILRFDYATVATIATLFGFFCFVAAANEVMVGAVSTKGWRILHWLLAALFVVVGVFAFIRPDDTFVGLAAVMTVDRRAADNRRFVGLAGCSQKTNPSSIVIRSRLCRGSRNSYRYRHSTANQERAWVRCCECRTIR